MTARLYYITPRGWITHTTLQLVGGWYGILKGAAQRGEEVGVGPKGAASQSEGTAGDTHMMTEGKSMIQSLVLNFEYAGTYPSQDISAKSYSWC